jgi:reactive intermediate/imine deaminase
LVFQPDFAGLFPVYCGLSDRFKGFFMAKRVLSTPNAPAAIGPYSQIVAVGSEYYLSGQIGLHPQTGQLVDGLEAQIEQVFANLKALAAACGGSLGDAVKMTLYLTDLGNFAKVNEAMARHVPEPYPCRVTVGVASLPRGALFEADAILHVAG